MSKLSNIKRPITNRCQSLAKEYAKKRAAYWQQENERESLVNVTKLSDCELAIYHAHKEAVKNNHFSYTDPFTNNKIWTTYKHFLTGICCGEACRHCIFGYKSVPDELKNTKTYNGLFWNDKPNQTRSTFNLDFIQKLFKMIRPRPKLNRNS